MYANSLVWHATSVHVHTWVYFTDVCHQSGYRLLIFKSFKINAIFPFSMRNLIQTYKTFKILARQVEPCL